VGCETFAVLVGLVVWGKCWIWLEDVGTVGVKDRLSSEMEFGCIAALSRRHMQGLFELRYQQWCRYFTGKKCEPVKVRQGIRKYPLLILVRHTLVYVVPPLKFVEGVDGWLGV